MSALPNTPEGLSLLEKRVLDAIKKRVDEVCEQEVLKAQNAIAKRIPEIAAGVSLMLMKQVSMTTFGEELRIVLKIPETKA